MIMEANEQTGGKNGKAFLGLGAMVTTAFVEPSFGMLLMLAVIGAIGVALVVTLLTMMIGYGESMLSRVRTERVAAQPREIQMNRSRLRHRSSASPV
jgi:hypothetical protein